MDTLTDGRGEVQRVISFAQTSLCITVLDQGSEFNVVVVAASKPHDLFTC
ncbi:hypothetical protein AVDCRST_MAG94-4356 [uncultured Leptolyngbya sp.]|uniref:Uncharacterized protein n=1 Tax=uncultured Leptolyngbya sp. TaxID=332963 RepID=A0A6J4N3Y2_9CYAN|nr:hypothetical protein AVDCRST_MAG94-4356 [uncultured Leptolyngbya sp.]